MKMYFGVKDRNLVGIKRMKSLKKYTYTFPMDPNLFGHFAFLCFIVFALFLSPSFTFYMAEEERCGI